MSANSAGTNGWRSAIEKTMLSMAAFFFVTGFGGLWLLNDLMGGLNAALIQRGITPYGTTTGFANYTYLQTFHLGLWTVSTSLFMLLLFVIWAVKHDTKNN